MISKNSEERRQIVFLWLVNKWWVITGALQSPLLGSEVRPGSRRIQGLGELTTTVLLRHANNTHTYLMLRLTLQHLDILRLCIIQ